MRMLSIVAVATLVGACSPRPKDEPRAHKVERVGVSMGSDLHLTAWTADEAAATSAFDAVFAEFERLEALMSVWRPGSGFFPLPPLQEPHANPDACPRRSPGCALPLLPSLLAGSKYSLQAIRLLGVFPSSAHKKMPCRTLLSKRK